VSMGEKNIGSLELRRDGSGETVDERTLYGFPSPEPGEEPDLCHVESLGLFHCLFSRQTVFRPVIHAELASFRSYTNCQC
jgi:hypothetical protein